MILGLITLVLVSIGIYITKTQTEELTQSILTNAKNEIKNFGFRSARVILDLDDLALSDNLQSMKNMPGYVYGKVMNPVTKAVKVDMFEEKYSEEKDAVTRTVEAINDEVFNEIKGINDTLIKEVEYKKRDVKFFIISYPIYHPFIKKDPPVLGIVQTVVSNEVITEKVKKNTRNLAYTTIVFWLIGGVGAILLARFIVKPINILVAGAKIVGEGNLDFKVPVTTHDELGVLADQFNKMTDGLKVAQEAKQEQALMNDQVRQAKEIQEGMNPMVLLDTDDFQVNGFTRAAKGVGGDYFDFQQLKNGKLVLLISDVSGKGISASLVMVLIKTVVSTYLHFFETIRPNSILTAINKIIASQAHIDKFATMMFTIYDPASRLMQFTNGGQGPLLVYRAADKVCTVSKQAGLPLGIDIDNDYLISQIQLKKGDMIILYTDGISEAYDTKKNEYSMERLRKKILEYADLNVDQIVKNIISDVDQFATGAEQHDDMTLVIFKIK
jgi:sigma-B regulation protein RsbU (phosphoserine phosphatase)